VVERALSRYAGHGGDGSGIAGRREEFGSKVRGQRSEVSEEKSNGENPIAQDPVRFEDALF
jgi:hypothetical protein